jgi:hypothetical protein
MSRLPFPAYTRSVFGETGCSQYQWLAKHAWGRQITHAMEDVGARTTEILSSFGWITNPHGRKHLEATPRFTNAAASIWDLMQKEAAISREFNHDRLFSGVWAYLTVPAGSATPMVPRPILWSILFPAPNSAK